MTNTASTTRDTWPTSGEYDPVAERTWNRWHPSLEANARAWANDNTTGADLVTGDNPVDRTLAYWREAGIRDAAVQGTHQDFKAWVSEVIAYKRHRMGLVWPQQGLPVPGTDIRIGDRVTMRVPGFTDSPFEVEVAYFDAADGLVLVQAVAEPPFAWGSDPAGMAETLHSGAYAVGARRGGARMGWTETAHLSVPDSGSEPAPEQQDTAALVEQVQALREDLQQAGRTLTEAKDALVNVLSRVREEADDRGWCPEFEKFLGTLDLPGWVVLEDFKRERTARVTNDEVYEVRIRRSVTESRTDWLDEDGDIDIDTVSNVEEEMPDLSDQLYSAITSALQYDDTASVYEVTFERVVEDSTQAYLQ